MCSDFSINTGKSVYLEAMHMYMYKHVHMHTCTHTHVYVHTPVLSYHFVATTWSHVHYIHDVCVCVCVCVCDHVCVCVYVRLPAVHLLAFFTLGDTCYSSLFWRFADKLYIAPGWVCCCCFCSVASVCSRWFTSWGGLAVHCCWVTSTWQSVFSILFSTIWCHTSTLLFRDDFNRYQHSEPMHVN